MSQSRHVGLVWFRVGDLRVRDNPALAAAAVAGRVVPVFTWTPDDEVGAASRWWLHHSLRELAHSLEQRGSRLILRAGASSAELLQHVAAETGAATVYFNRGYTPAERSRQSSVEHLGLRTSSFGARLLVEPASIVSASGGPFRVFAAYWRAATARIDVQPPEPAPSKLERPEHWPESLPLERLRLLPTPDWAGGLRSTWQPGEAGAHKLLEALLNCKLAGYDHARDVPEHDGTSRLSPHLHFGEISPREIWWTVQQRLRDMEPQSPVARAANAFLRELGWREFAAYLLFHLPLLAERSLDSRFDALEWQADPADMRAWQRGETGFPLVDAGMRQLWQSGWMHNRVRMVVASFLVKDLLVRWQDGARWFWDTLVDADLANNSLGWQSAAGSGPDAAPFTRVFNPTLQAQRFDAGGAYIRRWVPELSRLPDVYIAAPWTAPPLTLEEAGVRLGRAYPWPIVDHAAARARALRLFDTTHSHRAGRG